MFNGIWLKIKNNVFLKWGLHIACFVLGYLISFVIVQTVYPSQLTDAIQKLYDERQIDTLTAKILEHEWEHYLNKAMVAKCNQQSCEPEIILKHMLNMIASDRKTRNGHRYGFNNIATTILAGIFTHLIIKAFEDPVRERVHATRESWRKERENEMHRIRYREREREERDRDRERDRERARNHLIGIDRY